MNITLGLHQLVWLILGAIECGVIAGIPAGHWLARLPVPDRTTPAPEQAPPRRHRRP